MNFLELCQELAREATVSGTMVTAIGQTGEFGRVANWVAKAYRFVQNAHTNWNFLRNDVSFGTIVGKGSYTATEAAVTVFGEWLFSSGWRCYRTAIGTDDEQPVRFVPYDQFKQRYLYSTARNMVGRPQVVTERPDQTLLFWPLPDEQYTIVGEQYRAPYRLAVNDDIPIFQAKFHDVIVYRGLMLYAEYEGDATVFSSAQNEYNNLITKMEQLYLPDWEPSEAMA